MNSQPSLANTSSVSLEWWKMSHARMSFTQQILQIASSQGYPWGLILWKIHRAKLVFSDESSQEWVTTDNRWVICHRKTNYLYELTSSLRTFFCMTHGYYAVSGDSSLAWLSVLFCLIRGHSSKERYENFVFFEQRKALHLSKSMKFILTFNPKIFVGNKNHKCPLIKSQSTSNKWTWTLHIKHSFLKTVKKILTFTI